jgi:SM-20-related protein
MPEFAARQNAPEAAPALRLLQLENLAGAAALTTPYPHVMASGLLSRTDAPRLREDFPGIKKPGFFPLSLLKRQGAFDALLTDLEGPQLAAILTEKLGIELRDKPRMITVRKWSAAKDGRIHNDGEAKIATALLYLNEEWPESEDGGRFRVLTSERSFDDTASEVPPVYGAFVAFRRTENSWHGHKPFAGERRVVQITWLRSWEDYERKDKRGRLSHFLKKLRPDAY